MRNWLLTLVRRVLPLGFMTTTQTTLTMTEARKTGLTWFRVRSNIEAVAVLQAAGYVAARETETLYYLFTNAPETVVETLR